ncbi:hypothetical protein ACFQU7_16265 [Pseudoroseomonas wenyumeiae]
MSLFAATLQGIDSQLPYSHLLLSVADTMRDGMNAEDAVKRLWREDPERVNDLHRSIMLNHHDLMWGCQGGSEKYRQRKEQAKQPQRRGRTVTEIAEQAGIRRETLAALMEHHGYLEMAPMVEHNAVA